MHTLRTIGVVGTTVALLLSASVAFAQGEKANNKTFADVAKQARTASTTARGENEKSRVASTSQERMQAAREESKARVTAQKQKEAEHIANIKDEQKKKQAAQIAGQFENLNKEWTDKFMSQLSRYDAIVQKMQTRAAAAGTVGKDVTAATTAIQAALTAIATAKADVTAQAAKTYVVNTSTLPTTTTTASGQTKLVQELRKSFQTLHTSLFKDLFTLRDGAMTDARRAVQDALQALGQVPGVDEAKATSNQ